MIEKYTDINEIEKDALGEIANIGTGKAILALNQMTDTPIQIELPAFRIISYQEAPNLLGDQEIVTTGILLEVNGDLQGMFMFLLSDEFTNQVSKLMLDSIEGDPIDEELGNSAILEMGNIMCCSYLNAIHQLTGLNMMVEVPDICKDMVGALLSIPMIHSAQLDDSMLFIKTKIHFNDSSLPCHILFLPEVESLQRMVETLGM